MLYFPGWLVVFCVVWYCVGWCFTGIGCCILVVWFDCCRLLLFWVRLLGFWGGFLGPVTLRGFDVIWICVGFAVGVGWVLSSDSGFRAGLLVGWMVRFWVC